MWESKLQSGCSELKKIYKLDHAIFSCWLPTFHALHFGHQPQYQARAAAQMAMYEQAAEAEINGVSASSASSSSSLTVTAAPAGGGAGGGIGNSYTYIERVFGGVTAVGDEMGEPAAKRGRQNDEDVSMGMMD